MVLEEEDSSWLSIEPGVTVWLSSTMMLVEECLDNFGKRVRMVQRVSFLSPSSPAYDFVKLEGLETLYERGSLRIMTQEQVEEELVKLRGTFAGRKYGV